VSAGVTSATNFSPATTSFAATDAPTVNTTADTIDVNSSLSSFTGTGLLAPGRLGGAFGLQLGTITLSPNVGTIVSNAITNFLSFGDAFR